MSAAFLPMGLMPYGVLEDGIFVVGQHLRIGVDAQVFIGLAGFPRIRPGCQISLNGLGYFCVQGGVYLRAIFEVTR